MKTIASWIGLTVGAAAIGPSPYPILEAQRLGYGVVAINVLGVLIGLTAPCAIAIAADRALIRVDMPGP